MSKHFDVLYHVPFGHAQVSMVLNGCPQGRLGARPYYGGHRVVQVVAFPANGERESATFFDAKSAIAWSEDRYGACAPDLAFPTAPAHQRAEMRSKLAERIHTLRAA